MRFKCNIEKKAIDNFDYASSGQNHLFHVIVLAFFDRFFSPHKFQSKLGCWLHLFVHAAGKGMLWDSRFRGSSGRSYCCDMAETHLGRRTGGIGHGVRCLGCQDRRKGEVMKISVRRHLGKMTEVCLKSGPVGN